MDFDYDLFVIGAGSGGVRAARIAATHGARVAVAEESRIGGTCVIRGCVPKKFMVYAARYADDFADAVGYGWTLGEPRFDWPALIAAKDKEITRLEGAYAANLGRADVEIIRDRATVEGPNAVRVAGRAAPITARIILIATGGRPWLDPSVPGIEHAITSDAVFDLAERPERIVIVGGGYIAVEFAGIFAGLSSETTLVYRGGEILRGFDADVRDHLHRELVKRGVDIVCGDRLTRIERRTDGLAAAGLDGRAYAADQILMATGRRPNTAGLGLERAGVALGERGEVLVDAWNRTTVPSIYAVGDVTDRVNLTPVAIREGHAFADTVFGDTPVLVEHDLIPTAVFATPEVGVVGQTEAEVAASGRPYDVYRATFRPMRFVVADRDERMLMKMLVDAETDKVLGVHIVGPDAAELIQMVGVAMTAGATKAQFDATMALHPTVGEELVTMRTPAARHPARAVAV
jgi:glutathione reductase (NADPH)